MLNLGLGLGIQKGGELAGGGSTTSAPAAIFLSSLEVQEDAANGTLIGNLLTAGGTAPYTYSLVSDPGSLLSIDSDRLEVGNSFDSLESYTFTVRTTDTNDLTLDQEFELTVVAAIDNDSGIGEDDGEIVVPDPEDPETDEGGYEEPPVQQNTNQGLKIAGKNGGSATFLKDWGAPVPGAIYTMRYTADWSLMSRLGREAAIGFAFKDGNDFHLTSLRGNGSNPTTMLKSKVHGDFRKANQFTLTNDGAAAHGTKDGSNWLQIEISGDGATYTLRTSVNGSAWTDAYTAAVPVPLDAADDALQFGPGGYFTNQDKGIFSITIEEFAEAIPAGPTPTYRHHNFNAVVGPTTINNVAYPTGLAAGDILLLAVIHDPQGGTGVSLNTPDDFNRIGTQQISGVRTDLFWKRATGLESGSLAVTLNGTMAASRIFYCTLAAYQGCVASGDPVDDFSEKIGSVAGSTQATMDPVTTKGANRRVVSFFLHNDDGTPTAGPTSGWTPRGTNSSTLGFDGSIRFYDIEQAAAGSPANNAITSNGTQTYGIHAIALKPNPPGFEQVDPLTISGTPVLTATEGTAYTSFTVTAEDGVPPYTFSLVGTWPDGITIDPDTGDVSGTPTEFGSFTDLSVRVTDDASSTADLDAFTLEVEAAPATISTIANVTQTGSIAGGNDRTFSDVPFGAEQAGRILAFIVSVSSSTSAVNTRIDSASIGGVSASIISGNMSNVSSCPIAIIHAVVPTGESGDVVVKFDNVSNRAGLRGYRIIASSPTPADTDSVAGVATNPSLSLAAPAGSAAIAGVSRRTGSATLALNGITPDATVNAGTAHSMRTGHDDYEDADSLSISNNDGVDVSMVAAVWR